MIYGILNWGDDIMTWNLEEAIAYYKTQGAPGDQNVMISLLREIQKENGSIHPHMLTDIASAYGIRESLLLALIKRIPSLRLSDAHCIELCAGPNCGKSTGLAKYAEAICKASNGRILLKYVPCMRMCGKGPNIRWDGTLYHQASEDLLKKLAQEFL